VSSPVKQEAGVDGLLSVQLEKPLLYMKEAFFKSIGYKQIRFLPSLNLCDKGVLNISI